MLCNYGLYVNWQKRALQTKKIVFEVLNDWWAGRQPYIHSQEASPNGQTFIFVEKMQLCYFACEASFE